MLLGQEMGVRENCTIKIHVPLILPKSYGIPNIKPTLADTICKNANATDIPQIFSPE
jgi:hypothetical protein